MNALELSDILADQIYKLRQGRVRPEVAKGVNATAGRLLSTQKLILDYAKATRQLPHAPFLSMNWKKRITRK